MRGRGAGWRLGLLILAVSAAGCGSGDGSATGPSRSARVQLRLAEAPPTVVDVMLVVTGEGMTPIRRPIPLNTPTAFLEVPPGLRTFEVSVLAKGKTFAGSTTQDIVAGRDNVVEVRVALNEAPSVRITADRVAATPGGAIHLTCTAADPDGDPVSLSWSASGGSLTSRSGPTTTWSSQGADRYTITCTATDAKGASASATVQVSTTSVASPSTPSPPLPPSVFTLTVTISGSGLALVGSSPGGIACSLPGPGDCSETYPAGTVVVLTATPPFPIFLGWTGGGCSGTGTCTVTMDGNKSVAASFL